MKTPQFFPSMIATVLLSTCGLLMFPGCSDQNKEKTQRSLAEFDTYVKEHKEAVDKYSEQKWEDLEREYNEKKMQLDKETAKMDKEMKRNYANAEAEWQAFKNDLTAKQKAKLQEKQSEQLKRSFAPESVQPDMSNISGKNIVLVYQQFFNTVEKNKDTYTKEEWTIANDYWKILNSIRERLDDKKEISKKDDHRITEIRIKYGATKALNKPFAEGAK